MKSNLAVVVLLALALASLAARASDRVESSSQEPPLLDWPALFSRVSTSGAEFSPAVRALEGKRVRLRGYALFEPVPRGGLFLTRTPEGRLHPDDEESLPWDAVAVLWRKGLSVPPVPKRPTIEGTLRLGNRKVETETVILTLEDAVPSAAPLAGEPGSLPGN